MGAGEELRRSTAAKLQGGAVLLNFLHPLGFQLQAFHQHQTQVLMIAMLGTIHASLAWRSTGLPTSLTGAAGRKPRDAGATHQCTCRIPDIEHAQGSPYLPVCSALLHMM